MHVCISVLIDQLTQKAPYFIKWMSRGRRDTLQNQCTLKVTFYVAQMFHFTGLVGVYDDATRPCNKTLGRLLQPLPNEDSRFETGGVKF